MHVTLRKWFTISEYLRVFDKIYNLHVKISSMAFPTCKILIMANLLGTLTTLGENGFVSKILILYANFIKFRQFFDSTKEQSFSK